jgi:hypothetical protein
MHALRIITQRADRCFEMDLFQSECVTQALLLSCVNSDYEMEHFARHCLQLALQRGHLEKKDLDPLRQTLKVDLAQAWRHQSHCSTKSFRALADAICKTSFCFVLLCLFCL